MNERIQELIEQASVRGQVYLPGDDGHPSPTFYFDKEKFAELIVEECIFAIDEQCSNTDAEGTIEAITILQKHFGVEE